MPHVYSLTHLTGRRRNDDRRTVVLSFEVRRYTLIVLAASLVASAFPTLLLGAVVGPYALVLPALFIIAGLLLWDTRQRTGLKLQNYQAILDKRKARNGVLYASGAPIPASTLVMHQMVVVPVGVAVGDPQPALAVTAVPSRRLRGRPTAKDLV